MEISFDWLSWVIVGIVLLVVGYLMKTHLSESILKSIGQILFWIGIILVVIGIVLLIIGVI